MDLPTTSYSTLSRIQNNGGSNSAWSAFDARYREVILNWCHRRGLGADAEDVAQEILVKLLRALPQHVHDPARGPFRKWLKTIVENTLRDVWRNRVRKPQPAVIGGSTFVAQLANLQDLENGIDELSTAIGQRCPVGIHIVERVRARVKEKTWAIFVQFVLEKRPAAEIAAEYALTTATVFKYVYRVKQTLLEEERVANQLPPTDRS